MPPPRPLKIGDKAYFLLNPTGRHSYEIACRGSDLEGLVEIGRDWLEEPEPRNNYSEEYLVVEVRVLKEMTRRPRRARVSIRSK